MRRAVAVLLLVLAGPAQGREVIRGAVTAVEDGVTLSVAGTRVRLWGIRAPAADQRCAGTTPLETLTAGHAVACHAYWIAADGTVVGSCRRGTEDLAGVLVRLGAALDDPRLSGGAYQADQDAAITRRAGLWAGAAADR